ncbi:MAG: hypothetical protein Aureis2KO_06240 [Aureisphaera sp.]
MEHPIFKKIENSQSPDFGDIFSKSFELYKQVFTQGMVHVLVSLVVIIPFVLVIYIPILPMYIDAISGGYDPYYGDTMFDNYSPVIIILWFLLVLVLSFLMQAVNYSIYGNFLKMLKNEDMGLSEETGGYFSLLKKHFSKLVMLTLATMGIAILAALLCYLPLLYAMVPLQLMLPIFVFNEDLSVGDIVKAAFKLGNKHWFIIFGLLFVGSLLSSLGAILCYIGMIATLFFTYIILYYIYKETVGFEDDNAISNIGQSEDE